jgi:hypothetical protein
MDLTGWIMEGVAEALEETGAEMAERIIESISTSCDGDHSPVGSPPYTETGTLIASVGYSVATLGPSEMVMSVGAGPAISEDGYDYSEDLEKGTGKMTGPRPYVLYRAEEAADLFIAKYTND